MTFGMDEETAKKLGFGNKMSVHYPESIGSVNLPEDTTSILTNEERVWTRLLSIVEGTESHIHFTIPGEWGDYSTKITENRSILFTADDFEDETYITSQEAFALATVSKLGSHLVRRIPCTY